MTFSLQGFFMLLMVVAVSLPLPKSTAEVPAPLTSAQRLSMWLAQMDDDDWQKRAEATMNVARDQSITEMAIEQKLRQAWLSPEQRLRLLRAIETRLLLLPRGALGIRMQSVLRKVQDDQGRIFLGVEVIELLPGMPAEEHLRVGDVIVAIGGRQLTDYRDVSTLIKQFWPGDTMPLQVARAQPADINGRARKSRIIDLEVVLASTDQLQDGGRFNRGVNSQRQILENRVRDYFFRYGPPSRSLAWAESGLELPQADTIDTSDQTAVVLAQLVRDLEQLQGQAMDGPGWEAMRNKWSRYAKALEKQAQDPSMDPASSEQLSRLRLQIIDLAGL